MSDKFDTSDAQAPIAQPLSMRDKLDRDLIAVMRELNANVKDLTNSVDALASVVLEQAYMDEEDE